MKILSNFSTNFSKNSRSKKDIKFVIIHYTGMQSEIESIKRLKNSKFKVSCHYLINRKGHNLFKWLKIKTLRGMLANQNGKNLKILIIIQ